MQANVEALMGGELGRWLSQQVEMRKVAKAKAVRRLSLGALGLAPVLAVLWLWLGWPLPVKFVATFFGIIVLLGWSSSPIMKAKRAIKVGINSAIANSLGISYSHDVEPGPGWEQARTFQLVPGYDRSNFEDHWFGTIEGRDFSLYEAHLEKQRGSGKDRRWVTVFRGALIELGFGREFRSTTLLQRKGKHKKWWGFGGPADHATFQGHRLDYVDQVHPEFDDAFEVYSDDQVEARVLLHPSYIERLIEIERTFHGDEVRALFAQEQVVVAIESGNLFESGSMDASQDEARVAEVARQFGSMARLAMAINQNERGRSGKVRDDAARGDTTQFE